MRNVTRMGPDKPKGAMTPREAARQGERSAGEDAEQNVERKGFSLPTEDEREEEGYDQPESSAQKGVPRPLREG